MTRTRTLLVLGTTVALTTGGLLASTTTGATAKPFGYAQMNQIQKRLISGLLFDELTGGVARTNAAGTASPAKATDRNYYPADDRACAMHLGTSVKVNQNCENVSDVGLEGRAQAQNETWIASDPRNPKHLVSSYNDYRRGDGTCGSSYSLDGGKTWQDSTVPNGFSAGLDGFARQYWEAGGDTSVAWDSRGNAYLDCQVFMRGQPASQNPDLSSGFLIFRSTGNNGASWNFPGRYGYVNADTSGTSDVLVDKMLMTVDNSTTSRFRDNVYVTYTLFAADGTAYIYAVHSSDYGETFSSPVLVSSGNSTLCKQTFGVPTPKGSCNENQFSQPFTAPDGTLYVVWANFNNPTSSGLHGDAATAKKQENFNQVLISRSTDGGKSFSKPQLVGDYYDLPDCATYTGQDAGRGCVPTKGSNQTSYFRGVNYPYGAVDPANPSTVVVTYGSYINRDSNESTGCVPTGFSAFGINTYRGVTNGGCNNDILLSVSRDGGRTFSGRTTNPRMMPVATTGGKEASTNQFWQGMAFTPSGKLAVGYYDRQYGADESTGFSDITLSTTSDLSTFSNVRLTSSSMPPPTQFSGLFYGDYIQVGAAGETVYPIWSDTRNPELFTCPNSSPPTLCVMTAPNASIANDQDIFTGGVNVG